MKVLWGILASIFLLSSSSAADDNLLRQACIKLVAMGMSSVSEQTGVEAMGINPAGIRNSESQRVLTGYSSHFQSAYTTGILGTMIPVDRHLSVGVVGAIRRVDDIPETIADGQAALKTGSFSDTEVVGKVSAAYQFSSALTVGTSVGMYTHSILADSASQLSVDMGVQMNCHPFKIGISAQNIGSAPIQWTTGRIETTTPRFSAGVSTEVGPFIAMASVDGPSNGHVACNAGLVFSLWDQLSVSGGITDVLGTWAVGAGVGLKLESFSVIYAYGQSPDLGDTHKIGFEIGL